MPLVEAGFLDDSGRADRSRLLRFGPSIHVTVSHIAHIEGVPAPQTALALVDTGATLSCIDTELAQALQLPAVDTMEIGGVGGHRVHDVYAASVSIPSLELNQHGRFAGVELAAGDQVHRVLLGRSFLEGTVMIYDGFRGQVTIASARAPNPGA